MLTDVCCKLARELYHMYLVRIYTYIYYMYVPITSTPSALVMHLLKAIIAEPG